MNQKSSTSTKGQILETAARLFFQNGYRAIGVDTITAEANIGKMTLYRHFDSKDDLIVACLQETNTKFWEWFEQSTNEVDQPREKLIAFFRALEKLASKPTCYGCPFLNAAVDFPEPDHPGHQVALEHKQAVRARFRELAQQAGARSPEVLADQLLLLMDGAFMAVRMFGVRNPVAGVAQAAEALIEAQLPGK